MTEIVTDNEPTLPSGGELECFTWWDRSKHLARFPSVDAILERYDRGVRDRG